MNKKGITMISLIFYVLSFFVVVSIVGTVNIYIAKNMEVLNSDTDTSYSKHQMDKYLRKHFQRDDNYKIVKDDDFDSDYIEFKEKGVPNTVYSIKYYPQNDATTKGYAFLEQKENNNMVKKILITDNIHGLNIFESETALAKTIEVEILTRKDDETVSSVLVYGVER